MVRYLFYTIGDLTYQSPLVHYVNRALQQKDHHTSNRMPVDTRFHCPNLHIVDTHNMLVVAIARQPRDDS